MSERSGRADGRVVVEGLELRRLRVRLTSDDRRVITLPFLPGSAVRVRTLFDRLERLDEPAVEQALSEVVSGYAGRHHDLETTLKEHFAMGAALAGLAADWSDARRRLAGAFLTMEYSIESTALFNPSIVPHPDQSDVPAGGVRILMSLRATGEGHVSSIVFRTGLIDAQGVVSIDPPAPLVSRARMVGDCHYEKPLFARKLQEIGLDEGVIVAALSGLRERFTVVELTEAVRKARASLEGPDSAAQWETIVWLANSNYHIDLEFREPLSALAVYPMSDQEARGVEDLRLVRFVEADGTAEYYGTYTAWNGVRMLPMLIQSRYFRRIEVHSLNGRCSRNKGMALFPRRVGGHYVMCSRIDGENLYISYSDYVYFWESAAQLSVPRAMWDFMQVGNCGSPIETSEGWILLTHGVGPMRCYSISALLLDRDDPLRVIGHLRQPLLRAVGPEREGYVPNVVYTCGAMAHNGSLYIPFSLADESTTMAVVGLDPLVNRLLDGGGA